MLLEIINEPNPILRQKADEIKKITSEHVELANNMIETMYANNGVGLAAPQVAHSIQMIVFDDSQEKNNPRVLINPKINSHSEQTAKNIEGCLSCKGFEGEVTRWTAVTVSGIDLSGKKIKYKANEFLSVILQHEIDHLNGILITDIGTPVEHTIPKDKPEVT